MALDRMPIAIHCLLSLAKLSTFAWEKNRHEQTDKNTEVINFLKIIPFFSWWRPVWSLLVQFRSQIHLTCQPVQRVRCLWHLTCFEASQRIVSSETDEHLDDWRDALAVVFVAEWVLELNLLWNAMGSLWWPAGYILCFLWHLVTNYPDRRQKLD